MGFFALLYPLVVPSRLEHWLALPVAMFFVWLVSFAWRFLVNLAAFWTPDARGVVFAATTNRHESARAEVNVALWHLDLGGGEPRRITGDEGDYSAPEFTRDGKVLLAKVEPASPQWVYSASRLVRWSWPTLADRKVLTEGFDESVGQFVPAPDVRRAYFLAERAGHEKLFSVPLAGGDVKEVGNLQSGTYTRIAIGGPAGKPVMAATWSSATAPHELGRGSNYCSHQLKTSQRSRG